MKLRLHIWKQADSRSRGRFESHDRSDVSPDMSFLEMLDELNEALIAAGRDPVAGGVYVVMLIIFTVMPWLVGKTLAAHPGC